jgi:DNA polymerase-3 subunit alpha
MAYIKFYYPLEFISVLLTSSSGSSEKVNQYVEEAKSLDLVVKQPSILHSEQNFSIKDDSIIFGFYAIKGLGSIGINKILELREKFGFTNYLQIISLFTKNNISVSIVELLIKAGCFDEVLEDKTRTFLLKNIENIYGSAKYIKANGEFIITPNLVEVEQTKEDVEQLNETQFNLLGVSFIKQEKNDKLDLFREKNGLKTLAYISMNDGQNKVFAKVTSIKTTTTKYGAEMCFLNINDDTKTLRVTFFPGTYRAVKDILKENESYIFTLENSTKGIMGISASKNI